MQGRPAPDPQALLRSRSYVQLLVLAALLGVPVSAASYGFLALVDWLQEAVFTDLPKTLGFDSAPVWWPLPLLALNASRSPDVATAMIDALRSGHLGAAGPRRLRERVGRAAQGPRSAEHRPPAAPRSVTETTRNSTARLGAENVIAVLDGREPPTPVA